MTTSIASNQISTAIPRSSAPVKSRGSIKIRPRNLKEAPYSKRPVPSPQKRIYKKQMALLLPGHNEELIIATTIKSAIAAGQLKRDIFVVDDSSTDKTRSVAIELLGRDHVLTVKRSGKALAVQKAIRKFEIELNYKWLHVADADSVFSPDYFRIYRRKLNSKKDYAVAVGFVQSMRGNWISTYRALTYTYSQHVNRRVQSYLGMISVFPGPITSFRTDIIKDLDFDTHSLTEDFDITLQVHRKRLGKIRFIPSAVNYTQDPQTLSDFIKQNLRWQRGFFQGVKKYRIGLRLQKIDLSLGFQMLQPILFFLQLFVLIPLVIAATGNWLIIPAVFAADFIVQSVIALGASAASKRWMLMGAMPYFYFLRWVEIIVFVTAFVEVMILRRFRSEISGWETSDRRYELSAHALQDTAA
ncbi:MAG TPA: glycosyltransferase family 2 protein [Candidatus Saccharimonadales bacterium]|nr:glycosyltransferase family 2 protein [Candidatus Saccharimonadales bacterium]